MWTIHTLVLLTALCSKPTSASPGAAPIDHGLAAQYFSEAARLSRKDGGRLWGKPLYGPMVFVDPATRQVVANQADAEGTLGRQGKVWVGTLPANVAAANTSVEWAGVRWTIVMWPLPELVHARGRLLMHECFHRIQDMLGFPATVVDNGHLDEIDGRVWMRLEMRALAEALTHKGKERRTAIRDALAFRADREKLCGTMSAANERALETNEGLAEYTGIVLSGYGQPSWETRAAVRLEQEQANPTFTGSFAYATGPAYCLLLDNLRVPWRRGLKGMASLPALLAHAANSAFVADISAAAEQYGGSRVIAAEAEQAQRRAAKIAGFRMSFVDGPVLSARAASKFTFTFDPHGIDSFPGFGQVVESGRISDEWGVLRVESGGVLILRAKGQFAGAVVAAPSRAEGTTISGSGWTLRLAPGWRLAPGARTGDWQVARAPAG